MPRRSGNVSGYRLLPGSARRYLTPSGREISRYEYDSLRAREQGFKNRYEVEKFRRSEEWHKWRFKIRQNDPDAPAGFTSPGFRAAKDLSDARAAGEPDDKSADGPLARLLAAIGARDPDWTWNVGDTPAGMSA